MDGAPRLWIPRTKILEPKRELILPVGVRGRYKLTVRGGDMRVRRESPWIDNLITNIGLDSLALGTDNTTCVVGTGNTAPDATDTALASQVASTTTTQASSAQTDINSPYGMMKTVVKRFAQGVAAGNLAEVGIGPAANALFSRALIVDEEGNPTTLSVQSDEVLDVTYQLIVYPPLSDVEDTVAITGSGDHDIVFRAASVGSSSWWTFFGGQVMSFVIKGSEGSSTAYDGAIGAITGSPSGSSSNSSSVEMAAYSSSSYQRDITWVWGLNNGNFAGGIGAVRTALQDSGGGFSSRLTFQCGFSPAIDKDASKTLALTFRYSWGRA